MLFPPLNPFLIDIIIEIATDYEREILQYKKNKNVPVSLLVDSYLNHLTAKFVFYWDKILMLSLQNEVNNKI